MAFGVEWIQAREVGRRKCPIRRCLAPIHESTSCHRPDNSGYIVIFLLYSYSYSKWLLRL